MNDINCAECSHLILGAAICEVRDGEVCMSHGYCWHTAEREAHRPGFDAAVRQIVLYSGGEG